MRSSPTTMMAPDQESPLLPADPAPRLARWTAWLLLGSAAAAVAFVCLVKLPEVVSAAFVLEPEAGADPLQAPLAAELAAVRVREGQPVKAGDELFSLRADEIRTWQSRLRQLQEDQRALAEREQKLNDAHKTQLEIKDAEISEAERELEFRKKYLATSEEFLRRSRRMAEDKLLSEVELMRDQLQTAEAEKEVAVGLKSQRQLELQRKELETARARERIDEASQAQKIQIQLTLLERQLADCTGDVKIIRAPFDGVALSVRQRNAGSVVAAGAELCQLARADARPLARLSVPETALPRLKPMQPVRLRYDAYPYQRYGSFPAKLVWVSPAAVTGPGGSAFQASCELGTVVSSVVQPRVGMRGEARVLVGRRTVLEKVLEPLRAVRERVRNG